MSKIADLMHTVAEMSSAERTTSGTFQRMIKGSQSGKSGVNLKNKLKQITEDLKQVQKEAKGLDHKTDVKLQNAIRDLAGLYIQIDNIGLKAVESNED